MIKLIPYTQKWQVLFEQEKEKLKALLPNAHIEHIGSTAIPGIVAKPVIDIMIGIDNLLDNSENCINKIISLGYIYNPLFENEFPNRRYFQKNDANNNRTHQIHLVNFPSAWWEKHILFRNFLIAHSQEAKEYEKLKVQLVKTFDNTLDYTKAKTTFCKEIGKLAFFNFKINKAHIQTERLLGFIPQFGVYDLYKEMFQDDEFIKCYGVKCEDNKINQILEKQLLNWDSFGFGSWVWFTKDNYDYVGEGGIQHTQVSGVPEIELTYSLSKNHWQKGFATEIGRASLDYAFHNTKLKNLVCFTSEDNTRSLNVIKKLGFQYEKDFVYHNLLHKLFRITVASDKS